MNSSELQNWQYFTRPALSVLADGQPWRTADLFAAIADEINLSDQQRAETLNSGQPRAANRMGWALSGLKRAGAVRQVRNGYSIITDVGRSLLSDFPDSIPTEALTARPEWQSYQPKTRRSSPENTVGEGPPYWFVGAYYDATNDQTATFVEEGIWRNGYTDRYLDDVNSMQPGERIAIKAAYVRKNDLPFVNKGNTVSVMGIKATGTITNNRGDGQTVDVDWDPPEGIREWYFYTNRNTVWRVLPGDWKTDALIAFTFDGADQDIDQFRNDPFWRKRFGDDAVPDDVITDDPEDDPVEPASEDESYSVADVIAEGCFIPHGTLEQYLGALEDKKNLILQGPPGTGKTWLAKRLGYALIGEKNRKYLRAIQFHPSTSYEDFVRGWRPSADGKLVLSDGVLVIEEVNRGNLAQIFGELLTLLESEKRVPSEAIELTYRTKDEPPLHLPENLYIIGTMNLADRSLAIVDFALRRRFAFAELIPLFNEAWRDWVHTHNGVPLDALEDIARRIDAVNASIASDPSLGEQYRIGHSFFTPSPTRKITDSQDWIERVVHREIGPLLCEYWFDEPDRVADEEQRLLGGAR